MAVLFGTAAPASAIKIDWVSVGDAGNAADVEGYGSVDHDYRIGKYEVTNSQYAEFLNAVDPTGANTLELYDAGMGSGSYGGIDFVGGNPNGSKYEVKSGFASKPVGYVTFYDSLRFANWLHNGAGAGSTETGAYTLLGGTPIPSNGLTVTRNAGAKIFIASHDEWYKAAYYDASTLSYNPYPFADGFNGAVCEAPAGTTSHSANCDETIGSLSDVGAYAGSQSAYGTFDQGGNLWEWNEDIINEEFRGRRGGAFGAPPETLAAVGQFRGGNPGRATYSSGTTFRVASIPEANTALLIGTAFLALTGRRRLAA